MTPTDKLSVELEMQQWNQLLQLMHEVPVPMRVTLPLVQAITQQLHEKEAAAGGN